jgi:patatin-related protein
MTTEPKRAELRLALVCYGGVSLAIYMHGVTKELHKLVKAGRAFDAADDDEPNPFGPSETEAAYFDTLREIARTTGRRLSVSIDILAGASAGGINGVVLAKAIALDAEQERLRKLWIEEGDLKKLLRSVPFGGLRFRAAVAGIRQLLSLGKATSPLRGERMSQLLVGALDDMKQGSGGSRDGTLIPDGGSVSLFVTATDLYGFSVLVPSGVGGASQRDRSHQQVLEFTAEPGDVADFGADQNLALAFAARATSSFPGAFAPVSVGSFALETEKRWTTRPNLFRYRYDENRLRTEDVWFVDGGTLNNRPFDLVIDAIATRPAETEVLRRIVYIQPDPGQPLDKLPKTPDPKAPPRQAKGYLKSLWEVLGGVRHSHPILPDLLEIRDLNWRIDQVGAIAKQEMGEVVTQLEKAVQAAGLSSPGEVSVDELEEVSDQVHERAIQTTGPAYGTYQRLKVESTVSRLADEVSDRFQYPLDSARAAFIRAAFSAWARKVPEWSGGDAAQLNAALLDAADVPYRERRMLFLIAGINEMYDGDTAPKRSSLDQLKANAWQILVQLRADTSAAVGGLSTDVVGFLDRRALDPQLLTDPDAYAKAHVDCFGRLFEDYRSALGESQGDSSARLWKAFQATTGTWSAQQRQGPIRRYLGFPLWDALIFPTISLAQLPQFSPIPVSQYSPHTARAVQPDGNQKLKGVVLRHFGAFL